MSQWLLPVTAALTARQIYVSGGRKDTGQGVHFMLPALLQLTVLSYGIKECLMSWLQFVQNVAACVGRSTLRLHHASAAAAALASSLT